MSVTADAVIEVRGLRKRYKDVVAVDGIDFSVARGEIFGLLGPNGAGKTTTVETLEGLRQPDEGTVRVLGIDVTHDVDAIQERLGVQLQTAALYPYLTVEELLALFGTFFRHALPTDQLIEELDLRERRKAQTRHLSGGQRQRLSVALALVNDPEIVFLDEPTTGLDPQARHALWGLIERLRARGKTILLTTHYMDEAERLCDRVAIMDHGRILEIGTVTELIGRHFQDRAVLYDRLEALDDAVVAAISGVRRVTHEEDQTLVFTRDVPGTIAAVLAAAEQRGLELANLHVRRATLEDVFLDLTGRALRE